MSKNEFHVIEYKIQCIGMIGIRRSEFNPYFFYSNYNSNNNTFAIRFLKWIQNIMSCVPVGKNVCLIRTICSSSTGNSTPYLLLSPPLCCTHTNYHINILKFPSVRLSVCPCVCSRLTFYWKELRIWLKIFAFFPRRLQAAILFFLF
jgi:hypothetical protein